MSRTSHQIRAGLVRLLALSAASPPAARARPIDPGPPPGGAPVTNLTPKRSAGFDVGAAGIGAAAGVAFCLLAVGGARTASRRRMRRRVRSEVLAA